MEKVVATVSGYQGSERFNLIKLIAKAGGNYVGTMSDSVTHLVCWRFQGRKYELARKSGKTFIVNHRWIKDCIKKGRRVQENPYMVQCGEEVGPLMNTTLVSGSNKSTEFNYNDTWIDNALEEYIPDHEIEKHKSGQEKKRRCLKHNHNLSNRHRLDGPSISGSCRTETEEPSPERPLFLTPKKRDKELPETSLKRRRLVKKNIRDVLEISNSEQSPQIQSLPEDEGILHSNDINVEHEGISNESETTKFSNAEDLEKRTDDPEEILTMINGENSTTNPNGDNPLSPFNSPPKHMLDVGVDERGENCVRLPTSPERSCVICWTDFSSTRGLLPCGHRFCFSCIQSWADQMVSCGKTSTCPLCKVEFAWITKVDAVVSSDQKIYSQTIPHDRPGSDIYILPDGGTSHFPANTSTMPPVCCQCLSRAPEELLIYCHVCQVRCIHEYCLDPPLQPWSCLHCKDMQRHYLSYYRPVW
ncbi:unnamed protein product [Cuscuta campestris]|uniref:RING-type E3 ubiquitin transferase BRCA1 n=1 Tax=Cuscuta campestris TaxID=132261 RepID=A0A484LU83_9ASTE|nr:unnamed protein product [Cuscuta campestris]